MYIIRNAQLVNYVYYQWDTERLFKFSVYRQKEYCDIFFFSEKNI